MNVLWLSAHPDPRSLNGALRDAGTRWLREEGHEVVESDLYAMGWDPVVRASDFGHDPRRRLDVLEASEQALDAGCLSADIRREQSKLLRAETVVVQFPLWWFGVPAILKGWFDRLFVQGFAQGVIDPVSGRARRYGDGGLVGRRALVVTTVGANAATTGPRGIHGEITEVLFPLLHGTLWYSGMEVLPPLVVNEAVRLSGPAYGDAVANLRDRLSSLRTDEPLDYRSQDGGDYDEHLVLRDEHATGRTGVAVHRASGSPQAQRTASRPDPLAS